MPLYAGKVDVPQDWGFIFHLALRTWHFDMLRGKKTEHQNDLFSRTRIGQLANNLNKGLVMALALGCGELHRQHIKIWQADDGWGSWVAAHAYKQNIMIVCYDNTVNGQKLADVDCGLDSACIPTADGRAGLAGWGPPHACVKEDWKHTCMVQGVAQKTGFKAMIQNFFFFLFSFFIFFLIAWGEIHISSRLLRAAVAVCSPHEYIADSLKTLSEIWMRNCRADN